MAKHVSLEMNTLFGRVMTLCARKRLLTTMNPHVAFQFAGRFACVAALVAAVGFGIFFQMICLHFHVFLKLGIV